MKNIILGLMSLALVACASSNSNENYERLVDKIKNSENNKSSASVLNANDIPNFDETNDLVAPGFLFLLSHPSDDKLTGRYRISTDGFLTLPYNIRIQTKGLTFQDLSQKVSKSFESFFQRGVQDITFKLIERKYFVEVRGMVKKSGYYLVNRKESLDKVVDMAGGVNGDVKKELYAVAFKQMDRSYSLSLNQYLENNVFSGAVTWTGYDSIFIKLLNEDSTNDSVPTVTIIGGVQNPGKILYSEDASLFYYLTKSGGVIPNLGYQEAYVMRQTDSGLKRIHFNITKVETIPTIQPNDVILLNADKRTPTDKFFERLTQISALLTTMAFLIIAL
ncbi:MAG: SLBB domain-containing protein [Bacteriovoracaceae bacterium]|nr:SLBB domain-containing protein [Bacteriovoracaceae bacterium]